jgi:hypothetical protein
MLACNRVPSARRPRRPSVLALRERERRRPVDLVQLLHVLPAVPGRDAVEQREQLRVRHVAPRVPSDETAAVVVRQRRPAAVAGKTCVPRLETIVSSSGVPAAAACMARASASGASAE